MMHLHMLQMLMSSHQIQSYFFVYEQEKFIFLYAIICDCRLISSLFSFVGCCCCYCFYCFYCLYVSHSILKKMTWISYCHPYFSLNCLFYSFVVVFFYYDNNIIPVIYIYLSTASLLINHQANAFKSNFSILILGAAFFKSISV